jgi:uncharacterized protein with von Willebrand factor type A (vWA) domain
MEQRIVQFISALRNSGVRVSLAESEDAFHAIRLMGVQDRDVFQMALRSTLVKDFHAIPVFDELFPLFFGHNQPPVGENVLQNLTPDELEMLAQALEQLAQRWRNLLDRLMEGDQLTDEELAQLAMLTGLQNIDQMRYREWMSRRMEQSIGLSKLDEALEALLELLEAMGMEMEKQQELKAAFQANARALSEQIRQYTGEQIARQISEQPPEAAQNEVYQRPFHALSEKDMEVLRKDVKRLASLLRTRLALRRKRAKNGRLDPKSTIRHNLRHQNVPIVLKFRDRQLKPRLVVICDISTSMRYCSELMLSLLYTLQDQISKTFAFAFIHDMEFVSPYFSGRTVQEAVREILVKNPSGYYNTDLGSSLETYVKGYFDTLDSRTTFIVVGDGRNNYNDPRIDLVEKINRRARQLIWLNPEAPHLWGSGDSDMLKYAQWCDLLLHVRNLSDLTAAIDRLLT